MPPLLLFPPFSSPPLAAQTCAPITAISDILQEADDAIAVMLPFCLLIRLSGVSSFCRPKNSEAPSVGKAAQLRNGGALRSNSRLVSTPD